MVPRILAFLMLAALAPLLSGCATGDPPSDRDGSPTTGNGGSDGAGQGGTAGTTTGAGTGSDAPFEAPPGWTEGPRDDRFPGLRIFGDVQGEDRQFQLDAVAVNEGPHTYKVSSICVDPWSELMERGGETVQHREPRATCLAFGLEPFRPGEQRDFQASWNATVWQDGSGGGSYEDAPAGGYTWSALFQVYKGGGEDDLDYDESGHVTVALELTVG